MVMFAAQDGYNGRELWALPVAGCGVQDLLLDNETIDGSSLYTACSSITATDYVVVMGTGIATFRAGSEIVFGNGFEVATGGTFTAEIDATF